MEIIRSYALTDWWKYMAGLALLFASSFFMFWLLAHGWWGYGLYLLGMAAGLFIIIRAVFFARKNVLILTSERVVDIERPGWFDEIISSAGLADVKDIFIRKKGLGPNLFGYGNLSIETRSNQVHLQAEKIRCPQVWQDRITTARDEFRRSRHLNDKQAVYSAFIKMLPEFDEAELCEARDLISKRLQEFNL